MARYKIYDKTGAEKAEVSKLSYSGTWMQECTLTVTVNAPAPLLFAPGDYIDYRDERFWIDIDPDVKKQARAGYNGSSFVYDDLTFYNAIRELKVCDFLDYVLSGKNTYTYSAASSVVFFASTVEDFANRIQSNLDRLYTGSNKWKILVDDNIKDRSKTFDGAGNQIIRDKTVSISNAKIFDILSEIEDTFHTTYTIRDKVIKIGFAPDDITPTSDGETDAFEYYDESEGKRKGLVSLEKIVNSQYSVITRLRAYGSERNMPSRYYANRYTTIVISNEDMPRYGVISTEAGDGNKNIDFTGFKGDGFNSYTYATYDWFIKTNVKLPVAFEKVTLELNGSTDWMYVAKWGGIAKEMFPDPMNVSLRIESGYADKGRTDVTADLVQVVPWRDTSSKGNAKSPIFYLGFRLTRMSSELTDAMADVFASQLCSWSQDSNDYPTIYSISGFCADAFDETYKVYDEKADTLTLSIFNLMLPGFPTKSLQEYVYGTDDEGGNKDLQSWIKECYGKADALDGHLSTDKFFPYIDSPNIDAYGVRESNIYFTEDSDDFDEVYPSIETGWNGNEKNYFTFVDETGETIENSSGYNDQGIFTNVEVGAVGVKVPYAGFDWADVWTDNMALSMKSGMCAGREFTVSKVVNINGVAENGAILFLERAYDENVQRYFPYKDYPLTAKSDADGGDRYVVLNIEMPASYVESAAEVAFKQAVLYLSQHDSPSFIYTPALSSVYIQRERDAREETGDVKNSVWYKIKEGSAITFKDENIMGSGSETHVIKTLSIKEGDGMIPSYEITIQEDEPETKLSALEKQINSLTSSSSATTVGSSSTSTSASRMLKTKLNSSWFRELFVAYDKEGNEVKPNSETEIDYIEPIVTLKGQQSGEGEDKGIISADKAKEADHAAKADLATKAEQADYATEAINAQKAEEADHAEKADYATSAGEADYATKSGYADKAGDLANESPVYDKFLRKDVDDTAKGKITLEGGAEVQNGLAVHGDTTFGDFTSGIAGGTGARITEKGAGEMQSLVIREFLEVPELRYNRISIQVGNRWRASGAGIIESVEQESDTTGIITLHLEDGEIGKIAEDDICQGIWHEGMTTSDNDADDYDDGIGNFKFAGFYTCYFRIDEILETGTNSRFRYVLRPTSDTWSNQHHPHAMMHFVCYGNFSDTTRQSSRYSSLTYERYLMDVNNWEFTSSMIAAQFGDLSNLSVFGLKMTGYSAYLNNIYMSGVIKQFENLPMKMEIDNSLDGFLAWGETCTLTCTITKGWEDITSQVTSWKITRDSGDSASDLAWTLKDKVKAFGGEIDIAYGSAENDLGTAISTVFTITAEVGGSTVKASVVI